MARNFIPRPDGDFNIWSINFVGKIIANPGAYGLLPDEVAGLQSLLTAWQTGYVSHTTAQNAARGAAAVKSKLRVELESGERSIAKIIQARRQTTNTQRAELGIPVPDKTKTPLSEQIVLTEPSPVIQAKCIASKTVRIDWYPSQAEGQSEALPKGIDGVAIWVADLPAEALAKAGGGIPKEKSQWRFLAMDTNSPYIHNVGNADTVTLAYKAQWFDRRKRMGPFGNPVVVAVTP